MRSESGNPLCKVPKVDKNAYKSLKAGHLSGNKAVKIPQGVDKKKNDYEKYLILPKERNTCQIMIGKPTTVLSKGDKDQISNPSKYYCMKRVSLLKNRKEASMYEISTLAPR